MNESVHVVVEEQSKIAEGRRAARKIAQDLGFEESRAEKVAIVATEISTNILKHAARGELLITKIGSSNSAPDCALELLALDRGPGMRNLNQCLRDGFSTGSSRGEGLGAVMRLSGESDFFTIQNQGSAVLARWRISDEFSHRAGRVWFGGVSIPKSGELVCGDSWGVEEIKGATVILVADGLGHGIDAHLASTEAVRILRTNAELTPKLLTERVHEALRSSRGAAVAVARMDHAGKTLVFAGAGNICAQICVGGKTLQHLVSSHGTAGHQMQTIREFTYPWPEGALLIMNSDGLSSSVSINSHPGLMQRDPSLIAGVLYRDFKRGNDDASVVVVKHPNG